MKQSYTMQRVDITPYMERVQANDADVDAWYWVGYCHLHRLGNMNPDNRRNLPEWDVDALWTRLIREYKSDAEDNMGRILYENEDEEDALPRLEREAERGNSQSQLFLGQLYQVSSGIVTQSFERAVHWMRQAAIQGNADAQVDLAKIYICQGNGREDRVRALEWFNAAVVNPRGITWKIRQKREDFLLRLNDVERSLVWGIAERNRLLPRLGDLSDRDPPLFIWQSILERVARMDNVWATTSPTYFCLTIILPHFENPFGRIRDRGV